MKKAINGVVVGFLFSLKSFNFVVVWVSFKENKVSNCEIFRNKREWGRSLVGLYIEKMKE